MGKTYLYNEKLKYARDLRGWSQEELARRVSNLAESMGHQGVVLDVSTISRWERGRNSPSPFYRQFLCSLFEMNTEELGLLLSKDSSEENMAIIQPPDLLDKDPLSPAQMYDERVVSTLPPAPVYRRNFLLALFASVSMSGETVARTLFPGSEPTMSRHWPKVTIDRHKELMRVKVIQRMLNVYSEHLLIDGIFWRKTEKALKFFQENIHISATGVMNSTTWERLILPSGIAEQRQVLHQGSQVKALQEMLNSYGASPQLQIDGIFGERTEAATRHFQQTHQVAVTEKADLNTWCVLVGGYLN